MDFLKKHYEKVLLGVMLAGLIGVLVFMLFYIASDKTDMENKNMSLTHPRAHALTNLDLTLEESSLVRMKAPYSLDLETTNKLLNPMEWQKTPDGNYISAKKTGPRVAVVTNITPLYLVVSLDSTATNELGARYVIKIERQVAAAPVKRLPSSHYVSMGDKPTSDFALLQVKGPPENPDGLVLKLGDSGETVTISKDKPYRHVDGYKADFRYDPERKPFHNMRVGNKVSFGGVDYVVVDVSQNELTLEDQSNHKKTSLPFSP